MRSRSYLICPSVGWICRSAFCFFIFCTLIFVKAYEVQSADAEKVLIRKITLIDPERQVEDVIVNILIVDGKLDQVTKHEIPYEDADRIFDGQDGFLIGRLHLGEPASFMILDGDPRIDMQAILDTNSHTLFAIHKGEIVRNLLSLAGEPTAKTKPTGWFAYTPPPMTLPVSYIGSTKWNKWTSKWINGVFISMIALDRQYWFSQNDASTQQVGDLSVYDEGIIRDFRIGIVGTINFSKPWIYTLFGANHTFDKGYNQDGGKNYSLYDWRLDIPLYDTISVAMGKQKEPLSMERVSAMGFLPWQERSAPNNAFMVGRNVGVVLSGMAFNQRASWAGGVFNDWFDNNEDFDESANQYVGRITCLPYFNEEQRTLLHLGAGMRYNDAKQGVQYKSQPEFGNAPAFVDTGLLEADAAQTYNVEVSFRSGPVWVEGEYIYNKIDAPELGDPVFDGYYLGASWIITGEVRPYKHKSGILTRYPVAKSVYQGGIGAWEAGIRWSSVDLTDGLVEGGEMDILSAGLNWWLSSFFLISANYRYITLEDEMGTGRSDGLVVRIGLMLE